MVNFKKFLVNLMEVMQEHGIPVNEIYKIIKEAMAR